MDGGLCLKSTLSAGRPAAENQPPPSHWRRNTICTTARSQVHLDDFVAMGAAAKKPICSKIINPPAERREGFSYIRHCSATAFAVCSIKINPPAERQGGFSYIRHCSATAFAICSKIINPPAERREGYLFLEADYSASTFAICSMRLRSLLL